MPEEDTNCPSQDAADSERSGDRRLSTCSAWVDIPDRAGIWWKCFEGFPPHVVEISKHDVALFKTYGHDFRGPDTRIKYKWLPEIDPPESFEPNVELCQPCPPSTPPRQETADGQGLA